MNNPSDLLWGIDLGGTKVEAAVLKADGHILYRERIPTEQEKGYRHILNKIRQLVDDASHQLGLTPDRIGVGIPGTIDTESGCIKNANTQALNGKPFDRDLSQRLNTEVTIANDANCFALAETCSGAVAELYPTANVVLGLIIGTGVGSGIVVNGKVLSGRHGIAGEWGHNPLSSHSGICYCGKLGCVETVLSGPAIEAYHRNKTRQSMALAMISELAKKGDKGCLETLHYWLDNFGRAVAPLINILDPDVIVVGGGVGNMPIIYQEAASYIAQHIFNDVLRTPIIKPTLGDSAGVIGAAMLTQ